MRLSLKVVFATLAILLSCGMAGAQTLTVKGRVVDEHGDPLIGAGVIDKSAANNGTITDVEGNYSITVAQDAYIEFSYIGYESKLEQVGGRAKLDVKLKPITTSLDQVVVIGYGTSKKADLTGSVAVVNMDEVQESASANVAQSLQGRIAGVEISSQSGQPGESGTIQVRGSRSIAAGNEPLIIVDGMMDVVDDLGELNPADIVSISVLKDVSSTAIYGSRGANGVILVTTTATAQEKQQGTFSIQFNAKAGASMIANSIDLMNATEIAQWRNMVYYAREDWSPDAKNPPYADPTIFGQGTDWVKTVSRTAVYQDYYLSLKGNSGAFNYSASIGYNNEQGVILGAGNERLSGIVSFGVKIKPWVKAGARVSITDTRTDFANAAISGTDSNAAIYVSPLIKKEDAWNMYGDDEDSGGAIFNNPYICAVKKTNWLRRNTINISPWVDFFVNKDITIKAKFNYARNNTWSFKYNPSDLPVAAYTHTGGWASRSAYLKQTLTGEATFNYKKVMAKHQVEAVAGLTGEYRQIDSETMTGTGYLDDEVSYHNMGGILNTANITPASYQHINSKVSVFARGTYTYDRRYHFSFTVRADGASNFAVGNKWGVFPAGAFRWTLSEEKWLRSAHWLNDLSLRLSAGRSGNDAIASYMSLATLAPARTHWFFGDNRQVAYNPNKLANSNLTWETTDAYNVGLSFEAFHGRLSIEADGYLSYTHDLLLAMRNSAVTGYNTYFNNVGSTRNLGVEVTISSKNFNNRNFKWTTDLTVSRNQQTTIDVGEANAVVPTYMNPRSSSQYLYGYKNGYPVNSLWGYQYEGVWHSAEEIERNRATHAYTSGYMSDAVSTNLGRSKYVDVNHDGLLDENDVVYLGCSDPIVQGGFQNTFKIMNSLTIGIYFAYSIGGQMYNLSELWMGTGSASFNKYKYMLKAWTPDNPDSEIPAPYREDLYGCSRFIHDASYLRLKTVSIDYAIPLPAKAKKYIKKLSIGVTGENLWLLKSYNGFDPDVNTSSSVFRLDNGSFPRPRTIIGKVSMSF